MEEEEAAAAAAAKKGRLTDSVDRFLDASPMFAAVLRQVFLQLASSVPPPSGAASSSSSPSSASSSSAASPLLPASSLLPALNSLLQRLTEGVDPKLWRLSLRNFTYCDIQALVNENSTFDPYKPISFKDFEWAARQAFKNMAVEKCRRVGSYILGGIAVVHLLHGIISKVPYIGKRLGFILRILSPTPLMGPLLGLAGASSWEEKMLNQMLLL